MKDLITTTPETDEFAPIELGSVSEETKGYPLGAEEIVGFLSHDQ